MKKQIEERFKEVLDSGEEIVKIEKPGACRFFVIQFLIIAFAMLIISTGAILEMVEYYGVGAVWWALAVSVFCILVYMLFAFCYYKNTFYCVTNKRVIIRSGIAGVDYKEINLEKVSNITVKRIWFDKLFKRTSGTIIFGGLEDKDIDENFDEVGALYRLSGLINVREVESQIKEIKDKLMPNEETSASAWKKVNKNSKKDIA